MRVRSIDAQFWAIVAELVLNAAAMLAVALMCA